MQIVSIETIPVEVPVRPLEHEYGIAPYATGGQLRSVPDTVEFDEAIDRVENAGHSGKKLLIRLETTEGIDGWGEINVPSMEFGKALYETVIGPEVVGRSIWEMESLLEDFEWFPSGYYRDVTPYLGAIEMAMWDALGKHLDVPVHRLLGGKRVESIPVAFCLGILPPEESRRHARKALRNGFDVLKTKGSRYWQADVERMIAMHDEVDGQLEFRLDPNQLWRPEQAVRVGAELEQAGVFLEYLEQPVRIDSFGTLKRLRERLKTPIAVNEDAYLPRHISHIGREAGIDAAVIDLVPSGGILGFKRLAAVAAYLGISLAHHSNFDLGIKNAAKAHVMASTSGCDLAIDSVYYAYEDHLYETPLDMSEGRVTVPERPGLNGPIDLDKIEQYRLD